jgi:hypothetical protein
MYYLKISLKQSGLTNQIFTFINGIINAYKQKEKVVVIDLFLNDISKNIILDKPREKKSLIVNLME